MMNKKVSILGTMYTIKESDNTDPKMIDADGYIERYSKEIFIRKFQKDIRDIKEKDEEYKKCVIRHELLHGIFFESGIKKYYDDEDLIEFLSIQYPKIKQIFKELGIED